MTGERIDAFMQFTGAMVPEWLCLRTEIAAGPKIAYGRLARFKGRKPFAYPSLEELGAECGVGARQAGRYVAELERFDLIEVERVGLNRPNRYYFLDHEWMHADASGVDTSDHSGDDTDDRSGVDESDASSPDTSDHSSYSGSQSGSHIPPNPPQAGGPEEIINALSDALGAHQHTRSSRRQWARAATDLADAGVHPSDVGPAVAEFKERWPEATCTPNALARFWPLLTAPIAPETPTGPRYELRCSRCAATVEDCTCEDAEWRQVPVEVAA